MARWVTRPVLAVATLVCLSAVVSAQQTSTTSETKRFQVISVQGNQLVVRLPEGTREITVPDDFRFTVDGKQMSVHELKPGMRGTANVTTKTTVTPVTVTEVRNGEVLRNTGGSIMVRTDNGIRMFSQGDVDKRDVTIVRNGQPAMISDFRQGDRLTATIVTSKPPKVVTEKEVQATLARDTGAAPAATPAPAPAPARAARPAPSAPAAAPPAPTGSTGTAPAEPKKLPKTASQMPLVGLLGLMSLLSAGALTAGRRWLQR